MFFVHIYITLAQFTHHSALANINNNNNTSCMAKIFMVEPPDPFGTAVLITTDLFNTARCYYH